MCLLHYIYTYKYLFYFQSRKYVDVEKLSRSQQSFVFPKAEDSMLPSTECLMFLPAE